MINILFQGDSITDCSRSRELSWPMGCGYPTVVSALLGSKEPFKYHFENKGIGGDRVVDLYARMRRDMLNLHPDVMSILIGVNDVWHDLSGQNGVSAPKFERIYGMLIEELLEERPDMKIMILEPFVLRGSATNAHYEDFFRPEVEKRAQGAKNIAERFGLPFIPLQKLFDEASAGGNENYWLVDGVHPKAPGHGLIAGEWLKAFEKLAL